MRIVDHVAMLDEDGVRLGEAAGRAGLDAPVPTCPGWRIRDLLHHVGGVHRWAAAHVATGRRRPFSAGEEAMFFTIVDDDELLDWFREGHRALVKTLGSADAGIECWAFLPAPSPLAFWARRQAHETAVHRADAESATGTVPHWAPSFAADGIDELLGGFFGRPGGRLVADPPASLALVPTDVDAAWTLYVEPSGRRLVAGEQPAQLTVAGPASELYLLLWNRTGTERLDLRGDSAVLDLWRARAVVTWS
ncbi:maleylpyruvate isomerase family mycothiol-dependent enzyme [Plantactinospora sp. WMMC1484]|uniref:maleylpyruvate isomerase family mycothiol-dependent enzyme n=1 Tax=Plantactinospora sp. WMMC1484 TaxID=3404122 RepID=UPI003BF61320